MDDLSVGLASTSAAASSAGGTRLTARRASSFDTARGRRKV